MTTNSHTFLFAFVATTEKFIVKPNEVAELIREHGQQGIISIKLFDPSKDKFVTVKKSKIASICEYSTDANIELAKKGYKVETIQDAIKRANKKAKI